MSANNIIFIKKNKKYFEVYYQGCVDNEDLGTVEGKFENLEEALRYAEKLCREFNVEYGIRYLDN